MNEKQVFVMELGNRKLQVETSQLAKQATGSCLVRYDDTAVLSVAVVGDKPTTQDFFPLMVMYQEKLYAAGKIPGGFLRREGRPTEKEILSSRAIDRPLRPLFADGFRNEVQVINTVMSVNPDCSPYVASLIGSSLALSIGGIPFNGPVAGVVVGLIDGKFILNPTAEELLLSDIDLTVAGTKDAVNMVEAGAKEVQEEVMLDAIMFAHEEIKKIIAFEEQIIAAVGKEKIAIELQVVPEAISTAVYQLEKGRIVKAISTKDKLERQNKIQAIEDEIREVLEAKFRDMGLDKDEIETNIKYVNQVLETIQVDEVRRLITVDKIRPDGRKCDELRQLDSEIDLFERTHGSALFTRGQTQALATVTLGALGEAQIIDGVSIEDGKRFMLHYNFPQYSVGSTGRYIGPGRREIGHGALGERALLQVLPSERNSPTLFESFRKFSNQTAPHRKRRSVPDLWR
ncbi:MAG: polyribonucleotide nucleotidyltransferase [Candidatus Izemoplasmatales bacterium]|nr:polyribonucleotide nucleotidyltransferase [Candidatus Izemoplasmatales bacterium]